MIFIFALDNFSIAETLDRVVAKVNSDIITLNSVNDRAMILASKIRASEDKDVYPQREELMKSALDNIIEEKLQVQLAIKTGLEVSEEDISMAFEEIKNNHNIDDDQFQTMLENEGRSLVSYKKLLRDQILASRVVRMNMGASPKISSKHIKNYYIKNQKDYWEEPKVKLSHILFIIESGITKDDIKFKKHQANEIVRLLRSGEDFVKLAKKYSEDVSAHSGGSIGVVERGSMVEKFEEVAFRLKENEISDIVKTRYGFHIIKCDQILPGFFKPLKQVSEEIKRLLSFQNEKIGYQKWMNDLKENAYIEISLFQNSGDTVSEKVGLESKSTDFDENEFFNNHSKNDEKPKPFITSRKFSLGELKFKKYLGLRDYKLIYRKLKYYKEMRDRKKISETQYRRNKRELLKNF